MSKTENSQTLKAPEIPTHQPVRFPSKFNLDHNYGGDGIYPYPMNLPHLRELTENVIVDGFPTPLSECVGNKSKQYHNDILRWCAYFTHGEYFKDNKAFGIAGMVNDLFILFFANAIAYQMAKSMYPVLLIDGNMKTGSLHNMYGNIDVPIGLADVLSFRNGFGEAVVLNEANPSLHLLSCGVLESDVFELLGDGRFAEFLETLKSHYTKIFVILPPVLLDSSALLIANALDSIVLCVQRHDSNPNEDVEKGYGMRVMDIARAFQDLSFTGSCVNAIVQYSLDKKIK